jgi:hypothetical protein
MMGVNQNTAMVLMGLDCALRIDLLLNKEEYFNTQQVRARVVGTYVLSEVLVFLKMLRDLVTLCTESRHPPHSHHPKNRFADYGRVSAPSLKRARGNYAQVFFALKPF